MVAETLTFKGRLPGVVCEMALPPQAEDPLRLDVAAFVGFAERGPLDTPMILEDPNQYRALFGGDIAIATDKGSPVYANLPSAVRAFFDNGGQRCYAVRVAGEGARPNRFPLPGLLAWGPAPRLMTAPAAWVGRWSDIMSVAVQLRNLPLKLRPEPLAFSPRQLATGSAAALAAELQLLLPTRNLVRVGDLLLLTFGTGAEVRLLLYFPVSRVEQQGVSMQGGLAVTVHTEAAQVFGVSRELPTGQDEQPLVPAQVERLGPAGWEVVPDVQQAPKAPDKQVGKRPGNAESYYTLVLAPPSSETGPLAGGDLLRLAYLGHAPRLLRVQGMGWSLLDGEDALAPDAGGAGAEAASGPHGAHPMALCAEPLIELAPAEALVAFGLDQPSQVDLLQFDLHIAEGDLLQEEWTELRFGDDAEGWRQQLAQFGDGSPPATLEELAGRSLRLRAPEPQAGGNGVPAALVLPLSMSAKGVSAGALPDGDSRGKDGLDVFDAAGLFLDPDLRGLGRYSLMAEVESIQFLRQPPRLLRKLHSLAAIDEVALICLPDLPQRGFVAAPAGGGGGETDGEPPQLPDRAQFADCTIPAPPPRGLPHWAPCTTAIQPPPPAAEPLRLPQLEAPADYDMGPLLEVQRALVTLCASRADCLAVLALPRHFERRQVLDWCTEISGTPDFADGTPLSYAAVYHPWLEQPETLAAQPPALRSAGPLRAAPPDGAVCGMVAARERSRGAWIAPANEALHGVVRLEPSLSTDDWAALFDRRVNVVRQQPGRFALLSAHTLSTDSLLLQISVRRLLIFLRKLALRRGQRYVFENNTPRFRQTVQAAFERTLTGLARRGALAAFEVSTGPEYNSENDEFNGRLIVAIKVAPTNPIEFITVVMLRAGDSLLEILER